MKRAFLVGLSCAAGSLVMAQVGPFTVTGKIDELNEPAKIIFQYVKSGNRVRDTLDLKDGSFFFKGEIDKPNPAIIYVHKSSDNPRLKLAVSSLGEVKGRDGIQIYLDASNVEIKGKTLKTAAVKGSKTHDEYAALNNALRPYYERKEEISKEITKLSREQKNSSEHKKLEKELSALDKSIAAAQKEFIMNNPESWVSWNIVSGKSVISDPDEQKELLSVFSKKFLNTPAGKAAQTRLNDSYFTATGKMAPDFTQNNTDNQPVSLSTLRGKYVLIDFWASWCGPCRAENPFVKKAYENFKDRNFEILAVSLDNSKDSWLKAIKDDGLPWIHVSDLKGWKNEVAALYNVRAIPQNWLVDPNGKIIAVNLRGRQLEEKLADLLR